MNRDRIMQRVCVVLFNAGSYNRSEMMAKTDEEVLAIAQNDDDNCRIYDSLEEFQEAFNDECIDETNNYMRCCVVPMEAMDKDGLEETFSEIIGEYQKDEICMGELLAALPADGMTIEQAFEMYVKAQKWSGLDMNVTSNAE